MKTTGTCLELSLGVTSNRFYSFQIDLVQRAQSKPHRLPRPKALIFASTRRSVTENDAGLVADMQYSCLEAFDEGVPWTFCKE